MTSTFLIIGGGQAGAKAAETLRAEGFDGDVSLIGDEALVPYLRPPLSKEYLLGTAEIDSVFIHPVSWYQEQRIELVLGNAATSIDTDRHRVVLSDGAERAYDRLLLCTGSTPRPLDVAHADLHGVHYLRRIDDSVALRTALAEPARVVIIGGGWIGLETAAAARAAGHEVTLLERSALPLAKVLGPEVAEILWGLHREHGVVLRSHAAVERLEGRDGSVTSVHLADGTVIPADRVIVGVGITPNIALAADAGLSVDNGIVVDEHLQASDPDVFAAGDVANAFHPLLQRHLRVEHWANAEYQPAVAAQSMMGQTAVYDRLPFFYSDQYDLGLEYTGYAEPSDYDTVVFRGDVEARTFIAFWVHDHRVLAGMNVNTWDVSPQIARLIASGRGVDVARLTDPRFPLDDV